MRRVSGGAPRQTADGDKAINWQSTRNESGEAARGVASMASHSVTTNTRPEADAVVFSIQFYGKTIGEVGLMDQDLSQLDWQRFKSYIFQNLLSMNNQENICISYSDDEGDKLPIESEEEYREALKVAKKKAETHDKLVLDLTRQGGLPTVFSIVSSGIKRVSSSPPKEGGISFFKTSTSPPKDSSGFMAKSGAPDRRILPSLFSTDRGEGEMPGGGAGARPKEGGRNCEQPPEWFTAYMDKFREDLCEDVITKLASLMREQRLDAIEPGKEKHNNGFSQAGFKESTFDWRSVKAGSNIVKDCAQPLRGHMSAPESDVPLRRQRKSGNPQMRSSNTSFQIFFTEEKGNSSSSSKEKPDTDNCSRKKEEDVKEAIKSAHNSEVKLESYQNSFQFGFTELKDTTKEQAPEGENHSRKKERDGKEIIKSADGGVKRKKSVKEDEKLTKWLEKIEEKMARKQGKMEERFIKKHEKLEERLVKKQEKLVERFQKQQEKVEKRKPSSSRILDMEKNMRAQGKVLAKMEGLRKKQACSAEELSKLRKVVDKHHKAAEKHHEGKVDQRQPRRSDRKSGCLRGGRPRKIDIDAKAFPVDPSLLHKALLELESLAEDSPSESHSSAILGYDALYVRDMTYPDGSQVPPGAQFVKTWKVLNSGLMSWNEKTELCKWTQVQFQGSPVGWKLKPLEKKVVCPPLKPGECGDISITFIAPHEPGWYATHWRFCQQGRVFGNQIWCAVHVSNTADAESKAQAARLVDEGTSEGAKISTPEDSERKECAEAGTSEEQSSLSEEDAPIFLDAAKEVSKMEESTAKGVAALPTEASLECEAEQLPEYEVGIIENYYDAEDPAEEDTQHQGVAGQGDTSEPEADAKDNSDLISFEEDAEIVPSRSPSPDAAPNTRFVIPLKDIAKESVDSLRDSLKDAAAGKEDNRKPSIILSEPYGLDDLSISSGSFSDLDSEDQAILNESDTDISDQDYFVVTLPECFDLTQPYSGIANVSPPEASRGTANFPEAERHDSPDFLTADEDDRTTTLAYNCAKYPDGSTNNLSEVEDNEGVSLAGTVLEAPESDDSESEKSAQARKASGVSVASFPLPPTETKAFMDIPPEALRTNLALTLFKENGMRPEAEQQQEKQKQQSQESGRANWGSGREERQEVVCEQPVSAKVKAAGSSPQNCTKSSRCASAGTEEGSGQGTPTAAHTQQQLSGDGVAVALPDELVSIIPEDLVRGVWNTARTFITRINQEMLSPSATGPGKDGDDKEDVRTATPPQPQPHPATSQEPPQREETEERPATATAAATPEAKEEVSLPPPLQQLADMGFSNHEVNQHLLTKYNNDVACAVAELIVLNCQ